MTPGESHDQILDELKTKLNESEMSKKQLRERCSKLERVFSILRRKVNGLNTIEGTFNSTPPSHILPSSQTFLDSSLLGIDVTPRHAQDLDTEQISLQSSGVPGDTGCQLFTNLVPSTEAGDSLSSVDSSTSSSTATSWKHSGHPNLVSGPRPTATRTAYFHSVSDSSSLPNSNCPLSTSPPHSLISVSSGQQHSLPHACTAMSLSSSSSLFSASREDARRAMYHASLRKESEPGDDERTVASTGSLPTAASSSSKCDFKATSMRNFGANGSVALMGPITEL